MARAAEARPSRQVLALCGLVLAYCLFSFVLKWEESSRPRLGVMAAETPGPAVIDSVVPEGPAARAGLRAGDVIVTVSSSRVRSWDDYHRLIDHRLGGELLRIEVDRAGARIRTAVQTERILPPGRAALAMLLTLITAGVGLLCYVRNPSDVRTRLALLIFLTFALINSNLTGTTYPPNRFWPMGLIDELAYAINFGLLWLMPFYLPEPFAWLRRTRGWFSAAAIAPGLVWLALYWAGRWGRAPLGELAESFNTTLLYATFVLLPLTSALQLRRQPAGVARHQAKTLFTGLALYSLLNAAAIAATEWWPTTPLADDYLAQHIDALVPLTVFFCVYRHRLFDIDVVVRRGLIYTATSTALAIVYLGLAAAFSWLLAAVFHNEDTILQVALASLVIGLLVAPARRFSQRLIDRLFFGQRFDFLAALPAVFAELAGTVDLQRHARILADNLERIFQPRTLAVLLPDEERQRFLVRELRGPAELRDRAPRTILHQQDSIVQELIRRRRPLSRRALRAAALGTEERAVLDPLRAELLVPIRLSDRMVGLIVLGPKPSESAYNREEIAFLSTLGAQSAALLENARLLELATFDGLTGLLRRNAFEHKLEQEILRSRRHGHPLCLLLIDLDHFKTVNDRYGHRAGDLVLQNVAALFRGHLRATDTIGRFGGEEFIALLPETESKGAEALAETLRRELADHAFRLPDGSEVKLTISVGVTSARGAQCPGVTELEDRADGALYLAKRSGRDRVTHHELPAAVPSS